MQERKSEFLQMDVRGDANNVPRMEKSHIRKSQLSYLAQVEEATGWTLTKIARQSGVDPSTLTRFVNSTDHKHALSATTLAKIEALTGLKSPVPTDSLPRRLETAHLRVVGVASAGAWLEVALVDDHVLEEIPVTASTKYAGKPQYALRIEGNSLNRNLKAQSGDYAMCVDWYSLGLEWPAEGQYVHVQRTRGGLTEVTIKRFTMKAGKPELCPYSTDPKHQAGLDISHSDADTEVFIKGLVIGWFSHAE